jgi:hypothetical protein
MEWGHHEASGVMISIYSKVNAEEFLSSAFIRHREQIDRLPCLNRAIEDESL